MNNMATIEELQKKKKMLLDKRNFELDIKMESEKKRKEKLDLKKEIFRIKHEKSIARVNKVAKSFSGAARKVGSALIEGSQQVRKKETFKPVKRKFKLRPLKQKKLKRVRRRRVKLKPVKIQKTVKIIKTKRIIKPRRRRVSNTSSNPFDFGF